MRRESSFKFADKQLQNQLLALLNEAHVKHRIGKNGVVYFSSDDEEVVENDLICSLRDQVFPTWQVLTCPGDWVERYRCYMSRHQIPFSEELSNNQLWFLIPRKYRPQMWKMDDAQTEKLASRGA
jgi:hypothetical protein